MLSGNKYTSRSSLGSAIYQCLQQIPKEDYLSAFSRLGKKVTKMCFSKGGILWRFVIKICLIKHSTEVIRTQWQNFLQDPRRIYYFCTKKISLQKDTSIWYLLDVFWYKITKIFSEYSPNLEVCLRAKGKEKKKIY